MPRGGRGGGRAASNGVARMAKEAIGRPTLILEFAWLGLEVCQDFFSLRPFQVLIAAGGAVLAGVAKERHAYLLAGTHGCRSFEEFDKVFHPSVEPLTKCKLGIQNKSPCASMQRGKKKKSGKRDESLARSPTELKLTKTLREGRAKGWRQWPTPLCSMLDSVSRPTQLSPQNEMNLSEQYS